MNKQIAFDLHLSEITVKIHRSKAMRKLGARSLLEFLKIVSELNLDCRTYDSGPIPAANRTCRDSQRPDNRLANVLGQRNEGL
jgi:hypothetical protein